MFDSSLDRRGFLKGAAASLAALMTERGLSANAALQDDEDEFKGEPVKLAVVGLGPWGREILTTLARVPSVAVTGICDTYPAFLKRAAELAPKAKAEADYRALLSSPDVEAIVVATPSHLHKDVVLAALQAGKHVYCEAPLASSLDDARAIAAAAKGAGTLTFATGLQGRSNALQRHVWNFVKSGVLGDAAIVRSQWSRKDSWRRAAPTPEREQDVNWRLRKATSAGLPGEVAIHQFDLISAFLENTPTAISASGAVIAWRDDRDIPDTVECVLEYPRNVRALYSATLASSFGAPTRCSRGATAACSCVRIAHGSSRKPTPRCSAGRSTRARRPCTTRPASRSSPTPPRSWPKARNRAKRDRSSQRRVPSTSHSITSPGASADRAR
jgi:predicted dehydrogenase